MNKNYANMAMIKKKEGRWRWLQL